MLKYVRFEFIGLLTNRNKIRWDHLSWCVKQSVFAEETL